MLQLIKTADGSHTLLNLELQETYHSRFGAIQESEHVFIRNGLHYYVETFHPSLIRILEVGFGTGLNALLTAMSAEVSGTFVDYNTIEAFPLPSSISQQLNYPDCLKSDSAREIFKTMHSADPGAIQSISSVFTFCKVHQDIQKTTLENDHYDIVYFDAFAPAKQPELWEPVVLERIVRSLRVNGIFVTYSAKGQLRRDLQMLGMNTERLVGPPGKAEMIRAIKR